MYAITRCVGTSGPECGLGPTKLACVHVEVIIMTIGTFLQLDHNCLFPITALAKVDFGLPQAGTACNIAAQNLSHI